MRATTKAGGAYFFTQRCREAEFAENFQPSAYAIFDPKFGSWIMGLAAKDAKIAKNMQSDAVFGGLYTGRQIDMISPTG